jgi:hypothetical protein
MSTYFEDGEETTATTESTTLPVAAEVTATEHDLRAIVDRHLPGYEMVELTKATGRRNPLPRGRGVTSLSRRSDVVREPRHAAADTPYYFHAGDDTYVVWVVAKNVPLADGSDARCVTLSRREKRVVSMED